MASPADLVREACGHLAGYMDVLERLLAEPASPPGGPAGMSPRPADTPEPWNIPAGRALMDGHEGVRRLEAAIRYALNGHPGPRRGSSPGNTAAALTTIGRLSGGMSGHDEAAVARILERWINQARCVDAIDEAQRWRRLPSRACPYCGCYFLEVLLDHAGAPTRHVECHAVGCRDGDGDRPVALTGIDGLAWADGLTETPPDLEA